MTTIHITTKTGDGGESSLANGQRLPKTSSYFEVVGTLDELNSWIGLCVAILPDEAIRIKKQLQSIQETLFYVGAQVAQSPKAILPPEKVKDLEKWQKYLENKLEKNWHTKFLLPGGTVIGAQLDITRTVCRRAERVLIAHAQQVEVSPVLTQYLNRLSDYLYLVRCYTNQQLSYEEIEFVAKK
jgi:cob(I)alamin adenosyltransferase